MRIAPVKEGTAEKPRDGYDRAGTVGVHARSGSRYTLGGLPPLRRCTSCPLLQEIQSWSRSRCSRRACVDLLQLARRMIVA